MCTWETQKTNNREENQIFPVAWASWSTSSSPLLFSYYCPSLKKLSLYSPYKFKTVTYYIGLCKSKKVKIIQRFVIVILNSIDFYRAPTKAKSQEPAYSQALNQNKIDRQRSISRESGRQTVRRLWWMVFGVETGRQVRGRR